MRRAVDAGIDLVQVREHDLEAANLTDLVQQILAIARGSGTRIVVNDRLDVAIAAGAEGVHLRHDSVSVAEAHSLAPFLVGRSVHDVAAAKAAAGADYLIAGTVFATPSKPDATRLLGVDGLGAIVATTSAPVLAIGGVTLDRLGAIAATGAAGIAAIGLFSAMQLPDLLREARRRFDSPRSPS